MKPCSLTKSYDSNAFLKVAASMEANAVIPSNRTRNAITPQDTETFKQRNRVGNCFNKFKQFRRFATHYDRLTIHFIGFAFIAAAMIWLG